MRILIGLGHPAHFHLYKKVIDSLISKGFVAKIIISDKDILKKLLDDYGFDYTILCHQRTNESFVSKFLRIFISYIKLYRLLNFFKPQLIIGCLTQIGFVSFITKTPSIFNAEDDFNYTFLQGLITYPFISTIVTPSVTKVSIFSYKQIVYDGFHKLAYLHPHNFIPDRTKVDIPVDKKFFILRLSSLSAYHDVNATGINNSIANKIINILLPHGRILITSERELPLEFEKYRFRGNLSDIHHYLYYAKLFIGDSQSMAVEAAMLGTIGIRFNDFVGKISVLEEIENKYQLSIGIKSSQPDLLFEKIKEIIDDSNIQDKWKKRRQKMLSEKIDVTAFMVWFIENYPESANIMANNPDYQWKFK